MLKGIKDLAPIYYVTGNHEWWSGDVEGKIAVLESYGVNVLRGDSQELQINGTTVLLSGVDDPVIGQYDTHGTTMEEQLNRFSNQEKGDHFSVLLAHRPERITSYLDLDYDLVVSGHAHGGQVRIPFLLKGLYAPNQGFFPKHTSGIIQYGKTNHVISRGLSFNFKLPRVFNPPEIVLICVQ